MSNAAIGTSTAITTAAVSSEDQFSFHGIPFRFHCASPFLRTCMAAWVRANESTQATAGASLTVHFAQVPGREAVPFSLSADARRVFSGTMPALGHSLRVLWQCDVYCDQNRLVVDVRDQGIVRIDVNRGAAYGYLYRPEAMPYDRLETFFQYTMVELLKGKSIFPLAAAALEYQGKGVLLHGSNGCGKTTAMLSLMRVGYRCLADDLPLLRDRDEAQDLLGDSLHIDVADHTISLFPELQGTGSGRLRQGAYRKSFHAEDVYPGSCGRPCAPAMILFPHVTNMSHSCLQPLPKSQALEALVQREAYRHNPETAAKEFQALSKLVQRTACYRLHFGNDVLDLPGLITPLLERQ